LPEAVAGQGPWVITVQRTVETPAPRAAVESYLTDFTSTVEWDPNTKDCRAVDDGPVRVGKRYDNVQKLGPGSTTLRYEVVAYSPGNSIELHSSSKLLSSHDRIEFTDASAGGTRVTYTASLSLAGPARLGEPVLRRAMERIADEAAAALRERLARLATAG
jgi:carbon monoxide dehydrogenase subunit G